MEVAWHKGPTHTHTHTPNGLRPLSGAPVDGSAMQITSGRLCFNLSKPTNICFVPSLVHFQFVVLPLWPCPLTLATTRGSTQDMALDAPFSIHLQHGAPGRRPSYQHAFRSQHLPCDRPQAVGSINNVVPQCLLVLVVRMWHAKSCPPSGLFVKNTSLGCYETGWSVGPKWMCTMACSTTAL